MDMSELEVLEDIARRLLRAAWRVNADNQATATRLETVAVLLARSGHDVNWIERDWKAAYQVYQADGGRGRYFDLWLRWDVSLR